MMKLKTLFLLMISLFMINGLHAADDLTYEIVGAGSGVQGSYLVKVFVESRKAKADIEELKKCAVHGVLFKGFTSEAHKVRQKPLAGSALAQQQNADFYAGFFANGGQYKDYVSMVSPNFEVTKLAKKKYRVGATMSVAKDALRKDLEQAGVIKKLGYGF